MLTKALTSKITDLMVSALRNDFCEDCPNIHRMNELCFEGVFPRWGAGSVSAPIILILERPGDQPHLQELGMTLTDLKEKIDHIRELFTQIMFSSYDHGKRYADAILEYFYGMETRRLTVSQHLQMSQNLIYMTELVKCPGVLSPSRLDTHVKSVCIKNYFLREWKILQERSVSPILVLIASGAIDKLPSTFSSAIRKLKVHQYFQQHQTTFFRVYHPSYVYKWFPTKIFPKITDPESVLSSIPLKNKHGLWMDTKISWYLYYALASLPNTIKDLLHNQVTSIKND